MIIAPEAGNVEDFQKTTTKVVENEHKHAQIGINRPLKRLRHIRTTRFRRVCNRPRAKIFTFRRRIKLQDHRITIKL